MRSTPFRWRLVLLICLALVPTVLVGGLIFYAVRAAFWPSDSAGGITSPSPWPSLRITAQYPGANAQTIEQTITPPLEAQMVGVLNLESMESISRTGSVTITLYFSPGTDLDVAEILVDNRIAVALPVLPQEVKVHGVQSTKAGLLPALWLVLNTPDQSRDHFFLSQTTANVLVSEVANIPGVRLEPLIRGGNDARVGLFIDADKLAAHNLDFGDVKRALAQRDKDKPAEQLLDLVVKEGENGQAVRLRDVASLQVSASGPDDWARWNGSPAVALAVETGGDAAALYQAVEAKLPDLAAKLPKGTDLHLLAGPGVAKSEALLVEGRLRDSDTPEGVRRIARDIAEAIERLPDPKAEQLVPAVLALPTDEPAGFRLYVALCPRGKRQWSYEEITTQVQGVCAEHPDLMCRVIPPWWIEMPPLLRAPVVVALSGAEGDDALRVADAVRDRLRQSGVVDDLWTEYARPVPQLYIDIDREKANRLGIRIDDIFNTLQALMGEVRVPDGAGQEMPVGLGPAGAKAGRAWVVHAGANPARVAKNLEQIKIRDGQGNMVAFRMLAKVQNTMGTHYLRHIDGKRCMMFTANPAPGFSTAEANRRCRQIATEVIQELGLAKACQVLEK